MPVLAISRDPHAADVHGLRWLRADLREDINWPTEPQGLVLFHLAPLPLLIPHLNQLSDCNVSRVVAFSSTSLLSKAESRDPQERQLVKALIEAERQLADWGLEANVSWTVFRPTMIYGAGIDQNVTFLANFIRRYRFFPLPGRGSGLRQPVHAEDLADACLSVLRNPLTFGRTYELGGGERLTYRELIERIFRAMSMKPRLLPVPAGLLRVVVQGLSLVPRYSHLTAEMVNRMNLDLCFDTSAATRDFGFAPRPFLFTSVGT
jgi:nucleoside-diphosphate-sugar epimerase